MKKPKNKINIYYFFGLELLMMLGSVVSFTLFIGKGYWLVIDSYTNRNYCIFV